MTRPMGGSFGAVGILAYGSVISDPGVEIEPLIVRRIQTITPFPVEYARFSKSRGGAPTVVPHTSGRPVRAEVLALDRVSQSEVKNLLWRRETRSVGSTKTYHESRSSNAVVVRELPHFCNIEYVVYTDFNLEGKIFNPTPSLLATAAINSVGQAETGKDGISYLKELLEVGIETSLTSGYVEEILLRTGASDLAGCATFVDRKTALGAIRCLRRSYC
jgi:hypothetical protein